MNAKKFNGTLEEAINSFADGTIGHIRFSGQGPFSLLGGIYRSGFCKSHLVDWAGWAEGEGFDAKSAFEKLQTLKGLTYVALSIDDSPDFDVMEHVTEDNFPWGWFLLLAGAVRGKDGNWIVRRIERK